MALIAIPARHGSTRFPGKALAELEGRTVIQRVAAAMLRVGGADVVVVTDHPEIGRSAREVGASAFVSPRPAASGSDRIRHFLDDTGEPWPDLLVNVQGDEPLLEPEAVRRLLDALRADERIAVVTLLRGVPTPEEARDPDVVKGALRPGGRMDDFARLPLEDDEAIESPEDLACARRRRWLVHVGVYGFRARAFRAFTDLPPSARERSESLEQLRMLEAGLPIHGIVFPTRSIGIDTPGDLERARARLRGRDGAEQIA
ncbi:MAG: 3-deoxy-manno-octulosonate cytidylyltransferase [Gemmatimonadota bacterium]